MRRFASPVSALTITGLLLLAACGDDGGDAAADQRESSDERNSTAGGDDAGNPDTAQSGPSDEQGSKGSEADHCALLSDQEIEAAIGAHDGGTIALDSGAMYGLGSCLWKASTSKEIEGYPDGWSDTIEISVLTGDIANFARDDAKQNGAPAKGPVDGAVFDETWGRLWFDCPDSQFCHVHISTSENKTASGDTRQDAALAYGRLVVERL